MGSPAQEGERSERTSLRLAAFDLDGVIYRGSALLPGAYSALEAARTAGLDIRFVTNNSTMHRRDVARKLRELGLQAEPEDVLSSAAATAAWLRRRVEPGALLLVVGEAGLRAELAEAGFEVRHASQADSRGGDRAAAVVVGLDRSFDYSALAAAQQVLLQGGLFVATNRDATFPAEGGLRPGAGALVSAIAVAAGRDPEVIGKPHAGLAEALCNVAGVGPGETLFIGDRLETDIVFAREAGMTSVLVLTGVSRREDLGESQIEPDFVLGTLEEFPRLLVRLREGADRL
ncbi:MAG: HAD-IIA family hydrolase [Thermoleophilia bacterium]